MIIEVDTATSQIVWEWHAWDHLIQDIDPNLPSYGVVSDNPGRIDVNYVLMDLDPDWLHANSIDYNEGLNQVIINIPTFSEFWVIDHSTTTAEAADSVGGLSGKGGDILPMGESSKLYGRGDSTDQVFEYQHDAHWIEPGYQDVCKIMVFNNGDQRLYSSIDIIDPPLDTNNSYNLCFVDSTSPFGPSDIFWSYSDSANFYSRRGLVLQRLQNGNTLICSGFQGKLFEIESQTDSVVWEYIIPIAGALGPLSQGSIPTNNLIFRVQKILSIIPRLE